MSNRTLFLQISDMIEACEKLLRYTAGLKNHQILENSEKMEALYFNFQILGEVSFKLPIDFTNLYQDIPWRKIAALRHRIVHEYAGIDGVIILELIEMEIPTLLEKLKILHHELK
jgi:uncharacterized protein with HEPN domain